MKKSLQGRRSRRPPVDPLEVLSGALADRWDRFVREMARSRRRPTEPAIHDLRVAMRRFLAVMDAVDEILPGGYFRHSSGELRRHLKAFNGLRDVHIQILALRGLKRQFPVLGATRGFSGGRRPGMFMQPGPESGPSVWIPSFALSPRCRVRCRIFTGPPVRRMPWERCSRVRRLPPLAGFLRAALRSRRWMRARSTGCVLPSRNSGTRLN